MRTAKIVILCDERGQEFYSSYPNKNFNHPVKYHVYEQKFASIFEGTSIAEKVYKNSNPDMIVSLLGANDIICRHANGHISPRFLEVGNCVEVLTDKLTESRDFLMNICDCVILSHLVGMDLDRFNKFETNYASRQETINDSMPRINQAILSINRDYNNTTPMIQDSIHCLTNGVRFHKYHKLYDGFHPKQSTVLTWMYEIHKSVMKNL